MISDQVATHGQIVHHFLELTANKNLDGNWQTSLDNHKWSIPNTQTYINGVAMEIDRDYDMGWLIEVVDSQTSTVSYIVVVTYGGPIMDDDGNFVSWKHDSSIYERQVVGTFFDRKVSIEEACAWAVPIIFGMVDNGR
jgi:hypothetical protein